MRKDVEKRIQGMFKYEFLRGEHERRTHFGLASKKRRVSSEVSDNYIPSRSPWAVPETRIRWQELIKELREQIACFATDYRYVALVERRLLLGDSIKDLAEELQIPYQSARRKVSQAVKFLQINVGN